MSDSLRPHGLQHARLPCGEGNGTPLQYSCLENPMDGGAWWAAVHGVAKSWTPLSDFPFTFHFPALEKEMVTHSSVLAWRIPRTGEPGGLPSMGSHRVGHDWSDLAAAAGFPVLHYLPEFAQTHVHWVVMPSNHLILSCALFLLPSIFSSIRVFSNELAFRIRWPNCWSFMYFILSVPCSLYFPVLFHTEISCP